MTEEEQAVFFDIEMRKAEGGNTCLFCDGSGHVTAQEPCAGCLGQGVQLTIGEFDLMVRLEDSILDADVIF